MTHQGVPSVDDVVELVRPGEDQLPWQNEGSVRVAIRKYLILVLGWERWQRADAVALVLIHHARDKLGIRLPTGWDSDGDLVQWVALRADCPVCGRAFTPRWSTQMACSAACAKRLATIRATPDSIFDRCGMCSAFFEKDDPRELTCSSHCEVRYKALRQRGRADATLAARVREARLKAAISQTAVAVAVGITSQHLAHFELGSAPLSANALARLLAVLGLDCDGYSIGPPDASLVARACRWCGGPLPADAHQAEVYCSPEHRREGRKRQMKLANQARGKANGHASEQPAPNGAGDYPVDDHGDRGTYSGPTPDRDGARGPARGEGPT